MILLAIKIHIFALVTYKPNVKLYKPPCKYTHEQLYKRAKKVKYDQTDKCRLVAEKHTFIIYHFKGLFHVKKKKLQQHKYVMLFVEWFSVSWYSIFKVSIGDINIHHYSDVVF